MAFKRITVSLDLEIENELRDLQADCISWSAKSISFSKVLNQVLREGLTSKEKTKISLEKKIPKYIGFNI